MKDLQIRSINLTLGIVLGKKRSEERGGGDEGRLREMEGGGEGGKGEVEIEGGRREAKTTFVLKKVTRR